MEMVTDLLGQAQCPCVAPRTHRPVEMRRWGGEGDRWCYHCRCTAQKRRQLSIHSRLFSPFIAHYDHAGYGDRAFKRAGGSTNAARPYRPGLAICTMICVAYEMRTAANQQEIGVEG
jgi:hypothetical protein